MLPAFLNPLRLARFFRIRAARERYRANPGPEETLALARILTAVRDRTGALQYLKNGLQRYPRAEELKSLYRSLWAKEARAEVHALERSVERKPRAEDMARLIELHRSLQAFDRCLALADLARSRFPDSWVVHLAAGKALYHRYLNSHALEDAADAADCLRRARGLKPDSLRTLLYLAAVVLELGPLSEAQEVIAELSRLAPEDPQVKRIQDRLLASPPPEQAVEVAARVPRPAEETAAEEEEAAAPAEAVETERATRRGQGEPDLLSLLINDLRADPQVCGAFVFDSGGTVVRRHATENPFFSLEDREEAVGNLSRAVRGATERMGIGRLQTCVIEGNPWWLYFSQVAGGTLVVFANRGFKPNRFESIINRFSLDTVKL